MTVLPNIPSRRGIFISALGLCLYFPALDTVVKPLPFESKINQWIGQTYDGAVMAKLAPLTYPCLRAHAC